MGTQCAAGSKAAGGRREHAPFPQEQADAQGGVRPRHRGPDSRAVPEPNDRAERGSGPSRSLPGPGGSRTCLCGRPFTHPREQPQPQQPSPVLGSARCSHRDQSAPKADSCGAQLPPQRTTSPDVLCGSARAMGLDKGPVKPGFPIPAVGSCPLDYSSQDSPESCAPERTSPVLPSSDLNGPPPAPKNGERSFGDALNSGGERAKPLRPSQFGARPGPAAGNMHFSIPETESRSGDSGGSAYVVRSGRSPAGQGRG